MSTPATSVHLPGSDREIVIARDFRAPRELVWEAMTDPSHVANWWGPRGFTTVTDTMDVRPGGVWKHTMIGPDGTRYPNKSIFKEVVRPERIVYSHGGGREDGEDRGASFTATWTFEALADGRTRVTIRMVFADAAARDRVVRDYGAVEGGKQTLERLGEHLASRGTPPLVITREFAAPRALVWRTWTEREHLMRWWGPRGFTVPVATLDFRAGGSFHYCMRAADGTEMWGKFLYREIAAPETLVWANAFADPAGNIIRPPFGDACWPVLMLNVVTFAETAGRTTVTLRSWPLDATDEECRTFDANRPSMDQGWGGSLDALDAYLSEFLS